MLHDDATIARYFDARDYRLLRLGASLVAYTDGATVLLRDTAGGGDNEFQNVFDTPVDVHYGLAPVAFARTPDDVDYSGAEATSLMGCRCADTAGGLQLSCSVFRFSRTVGRDFFTSNGTAAVPVRFDEALTVGYLSCATVQVSVQPVRYPQLSSDEDDARLEARGAERAPATHECLRDPRKCNNVDALVYVKPLCLRAKSVDEQRRHLGTRVVNRNRAACVDGFRYSSCYPFCVGVRYRYSGAAPLTLYGKDALDGGIWKSYTRCAREDAAAPSATVTTAAVARFPGETAPLVQQYRENAQRVVCNMETAAQTVQVANTTAAASAEAPAALVNYGFDWVEGQPFAFAGDAVLVPTCDLVQGACAYTATLFRFASTLLGQYALRPAVTRLPAASASGEWQGAAALRSNKILLPFLTQDAFAERNLAAQTRTGVVYAVNPDFASFREKYLARCSATEVPPLEFYDPNMFRRTRLFVTRPRFECRRGDAEAAGVVHDGTRARSCSANLTREVEFAGGDAFLAPENLPASVSCAASVAGSNCGATFNLFISSVTAFDDLNVVVAVRHGLASFVEFELGLRADDAECYPAADRITTRLYFVNTQTLAVQREPFLPPATRQMESIVPPVMSLLAKWSLVTIKAAEVVVNEYALNLFGVVEQQMQKFSGVNQGRALQHSVFENRPADQFPLSLRGAVAQFADYHAAVDLFVLKTFRYVGLYVGLDPALAHWTHSGVLAALNLLTAAQFTVVYALHFLWDDVLLPFIYRSVALRHDGRPAPPARLLRNLVYEGVQDGRLRATVLVPQTMFCNRLPQLTAAPGSAAARLVFHACRAAVEAEFAAVDIAATMLVFADLNDCLCRAGRQEDAQACVDTLPGPLQTHYRAYVLAQTSARGSVDARVCEDGLAIYRAVLLNAPNEALVHADRALAALAALPQELAEFTGISTGAGTACAEVAPGAPSARLTLTPQPISAFKRCGYTKVCQQKCEFDLLLFYAERERVQNPHVEVVGLYDRAVPVTVRAIQGLEGGPHFEPLLVQQYRPREDERVDCDHMLVVLLRDVEADYAAASRKPLQFMRVCQKMRDSGETTFRVQTPRTAIPGTDVFFFSADFEDADERAREQRDHHQVIDLLAPHVLAAGEGVLDHDAVFFVVAWEQQMTQNGVFEIKVPAGGAPQTRWLLRSIPLATSFGGQCDFAQLFRDRGGAAAAVFIEPLQTGVLDNFARNPMLTHVSLVPLGHGEEIGLLVRLQVYFKLAETAADTQEQAYMALLPWDFDTGVSGQTCAAVAYDRAGGDGLSDIMRAKDRYDTVLAIEELPRALCRDYVDVTDADGELAPCHQYALAKFERIRQAPRGRMRKTTHVLFNTNGTYTLDPLANHSVSAVNTSGYARAAAAFATLTIQAPSLGVASLFPEPGRFAYFRQPVSLGASTAGSPASGCRARVLHVARPLDARGTFAFYSLSCQSGLVDDETAWLQQQRVETLKDAPGSWVVTRDSHLREPANVSVQGVCTYMDCDKCADDELRRRCYAAQNCAIRECVGTTFNHQNAFCVVGGLAKEAAELVLVDVRAGWFGFVEFYINVFRFAQPSTRGTTISIEALSNYYVAKFCELKDLAALLAATLPSIVSTVYLAMRVRVLKSARVSEAELDFISPRNQLYIRTLTAHATEVLHAVLMYVPFMVFNVQKLVLCAADKLGELSGGLVNFVDNDVGGEETNLCSVDLSAGSGATVPTDREIIETTMLRDFAGQQVEAKVQRMDGDVSAVLIKVLQAGSQVKLLASQYKRFVYANMLNTQLDWAVGVMYSLSRFAAVFERAGCRARASNIKYMPQCVCGDEAYAVADAAARQSVAHGALWCTGVLEMLDDAGSTRFILNRFSLAELRGDLDSEDGRMLDYLDCIAQNERNCDQDLLDGTSARFAEYRRWLQLGVHPLSVLTRCRDNFAGKTWDSGNFAVYSPEVRTQVLRDASGLVAVYDLEQLRSELEAVLDDATKLCLFQGPSRGPIARCMFAFFEGQAGAGRALQYANYFAYAPVPADRRAGAGHDACAFLSTPAFADHKGFGAEIAACQQHSATLCDGSVTEQRCRLLYSTRTLAAASSADAVDVYSSNASSDEGHISKLYGDIAACSEDTFDTYLARIRAEELTGNIDFQIDTTEGDRFHQTMDCVLMGAYGHVDYMPANSNFNLTNLLYTRDRAERSRTFELPCAQKTLTSRDRAREIEVTTCGSPARVSAIAYMHAQLQESDVLNAAIRQAIVQKLEGYKALFGNQSKYQCTHPCCVEYTAGCEVADVDFGAAFGEEITMALNFTEIVAETKVLEDTQYKALTETEVTMCFVCLFVGGHWRVCGFVGLCVCARRAAAVSQNHGGPPGALSRQSSRSSNTGFSLAFCSVGACERQSTSVSSEIGRKSGFRRRISSVISWISRAMPQKSTKFTRSTGSTRSGNGGQMCPLRCTYMVCIMSTNFSCTPSSRTISCWWRRSFPIKSRAVLMGPCRVAWAGHGPCGVDFFSLCHAFITVRFSDAMVCVRVCLV